MIEIWKNIAGYESLYQVSNLGRVKSLGNDRTRKEKILKPGKNKLGYLKVVLCKEGKMKTITVHRLVAAAFVQNDSLFNNEINHIDENKENNCASNLEWCDRQYNANYGTAIERMAKAQTNDTKRSKKVICIETGIIYPSLNEVQRQLGFASTSISACCNKRYGYKTVGGLHWEWAE